MSGADRKSPPESSRSSEQLHAAARLAAERLGVLSEASRLFAEAGPDEQEGLDALAHLVAERVRDFCVVALTTSGGDYLRFAAFHHRDPEARALLAPLLETVPVRSDQGLFGRVIESGEPLFVPTIAPEAAASGSVPGFEAYFSRYEIHSLIVAPLKIQDRVIGGVGLSRSTPGDPYTEDDLELVLDLASRAALAIRNSQLFARLEREARDREEVMAIVAHDLRNPLGVISTAGALLTSLAEGSVQNERLRTIAGRVTRAVQRMEDLITNVLDATRIESGRIQVKPAAVEVGRLLDQALEAMSPAAHEKGVELRRSPTPEGLRCACDAGRILQVFSNLIGNGIRFTPKGGKVELSAEIEDGAVRFAVVDSGSGIPPEDLHRVFDRYFKGSAHPQGGTGLGLYIARGIVEAHGGRIWAMSTLGSGSKFCFTLPVASGS
jgi:signal transduction histidine kinase